MRETPDVVACGGCGRTLPPGEAVEVRVAVPMRTTQGAEIPAQRTGWACGEACGEIVRARLEAGDARPAGEPDADEVLGDFDARFPP